MLPNFLGIGVQRAATTWLHNCLREHPEVFLPEQKEIHYFSTHYDRGIEWYKQFFEPAYGYKAVGEITPTYLHEARLDRIARTLPAARILVTLRHPVDRAFSAYCLFKDQLTGSFEDACEKQSSYVMSRSLYADKLEELFAAYDRAQVKVLLYEDIVANPSRVVREVFRFLDVDAGFVPSARGKTFNRVLFPRTQSLAARLNLSWMLEFVKRTPVGEWVKTASRRGNGRSNSGSDNDFRHALRRRFREDVLRVQDLIGRDLSHWV